MKLIPLSEAKANLRRYGHLCAEEPIIVTINGVPSFRLAPLDEDDDLIERLLAENPRFTQMLEQRSRERTISVSDARKRLRS